MRTTLDIEGPVLKELKRLQKSTGQSLGRLASDLLARALATREEAGDLPALQWTAHDLRARVNIDDKDALQQALERAP
jgi:hypothetical protein